MGFLSPAARGALLTTTIILYVWLALVAGFASVYSWGLMERSYSGWPIVCASTAVYFPGIVLAIFTLLNMIIYHTGIESGKGGEQSSQPDVVLASDVLPSLWPMKGQAVLYPLECTSASFLSGL